jgi:hypothetical protein
MLDLHGKGLQLLCCNCAECTYCSSVCGAHVGTQADANNGPQWTYHTANEGSIRTVAESKHVQFVTEQTGKGAAGSTSSSSWQLCSCARRMYTHTFSALMVSTITSRHHVFSPGTWYLQHRGTSGIRTACNHTARIQPKRAANQCHCQGIYLVAAAYSCGASAELMCFKQPYTYCTSCCSAWGYKSFRYTCRAHVSSEQNNLMKPSWSRKRLTGTPSTDYSVQVSCAPSSCR